MSSYDKAILEFMFYFSVKYAVLSIGQIMFHGALFNVCICLDFNLRLDLCASHND